jgi:hypothetical protein
MFDFSNSYISFSGHFNIKMSIKGWGQSLISGSLKYSLLFSYKYCFISYFLKFKNILSSISSEYTMDLISLYDNSYCNF